MLPWRKQKPTSQSRASLPREPVEYPTGIAVRTEKGVYRIHSDGKRYRITTQRILDSWNFPIIADASEASLAKYHPLAVTKVGFRDGSLLNNIADGRLYLVSAGRLRHVTDPDVLTRMGINHLMATVVSEAEINLMKQGESIG